ncbi:hypothetical protein BHE74_00001504 [Ensete ventricosum]|nr:hypothetical protein BHE74_00001504 [Ensete ventricosum]
MGGVRLALATSTATPGGCSLLRLLLPMASPVKHFYLLLLRLRFPTTEARAPPSVPTVAWRCPHRDEKKKRNEEAEEPQLVYGPSDRKHAGPHMSSSHGTGSRSCTEAEGGNDIARDRTDPMCAQPPRTVYQRRAIIITVGTSRLITTHMDGRGHVHVSPTTILSASALSRIIRFFLPFLPSLASGRYHGGGHGELLDSVSISLSVFSS